MRMSEPQAPLHASRTAPHGVGVRLGRLSVRMNPPGVRMEDRCTRNSLAGFAGPVPICAMKDRCCPYYGPQVDGDKGKEKSGLAEPIAEIAEIFEVSQRHGVQSC